MEVVISRSEVGQPVSMPDSSAGRVNFVRATERKFWRDSDGANRWIPALDQGGHPLIEDRQGGDEVCSACGTKIRWVCFVRHPSRGAAGVGDCCIRKVLSALPSGPRAEYSRAITDLTREMRNASRRAKGLRLIVGREERREAQIASLETAARDPRIAQATWVYNGNTHRLIRDVRWYIDELKARRRHSGFQSSLKWALAENGYPDAFSRG